jgi:hypothetical protein
VADPFYIPRAEWRARAPKAVSTDFTPQNGGVAVHHTGADPNNILEHEHHLCFILVRSIQNMHMDENGWDDIGYSFLVCVHGYTFEGRGIGIRPAAQEAGNQDWYAVLGLVGGTFLGYDTITDYLITGIRMAIARCRSLGNAAAGITGHRDHSSTECPGRLYDYVTSGALEPAAHNYPPGEPPEPDVPPFPGVLFHYPPLTVHSSVSTWQQRMRTRGWNIGVDGQYGEQSKRVCLAFQQEKGLLVDGVVGPETWYAAWTAPITPPGSDPGAGPVWPGVLFTYPPLTVHSSVSTWQRQMQSRGWNIGVDGQYGEQSKRVATAFQQEKGLTVDGIVGPATWYAAWNSPIT